MRRTCGIVVLLALYTSPSHAQAEESSADCGPMNVSDGAPGTQRQAMALKLGPPGAQNGHSNPVGIPPGIQDIEFTYLTNCGYEFNIGLVPGLTAGARYRMGRMLYGSLGGGLLLTANGVGPGIYSAIGASILRTNTISFEVEIKQALGFGFGVGPAHIISPYAFRIGAAYNY